MKKVACALAVIIFLLCFSAVLFADSADVDWKEELTPYLKVLEKVNADFGEGFARVLPEDEARFYSNVSDMSLQEFEDLIRSQCMIVVKAIEEAPPLPPIHDIDRQVSSDYRDSNTRGFFELIQDYSGYTTPTYHVFLVAHHRLQDTVPTSTYNSLIGAWTTCTAAKISFAATTIYPSYFNNMTACTMYYYGHYITPQGTTVGSNIPYAYTFYAP